MNDVCLGKGKVENARNNPFVSQIVTTSDGQKLEIPQMIGSNTKIVPLKDGTYKVITQGVCFPAPKPKVTILTEEELVAKYGNKTGKNLQLLA